MLTVGQFQLDTPYILAPMAGVSEMPYRVIARQQGAGAAPTELISAKGLIYGQARTERYMTHDRAWERPFWVQLFGGEPDAMAEGAARAVDLGADILDVNMGCPVRKVTRHGAGSGLLCDPSRAAAIIAAMVARCPGTPVTAKIRAGWDHSSLNYLAVGAALADAGCQALALHARTRQQAYSGVANWDWVAELASHLDIPVIGNGDVKSAPEARRRLVESGCQGVMIGRAALGHPWIFRALAAGPAAAAEQPSAAERWAMVRAHLAAHRRFVADDARAIKRFRSHLMWYAHGLEGATQFRREVTELAELGPLTTTCERFFARADHDAPTDAEATPRPFDADRALG